MKRLAILLFAALPLLPAQLAAAETLVLENGDKLTGTVLKVEDGRVHFRSPLIGVIQVPASKAKIVSGSSSATESASKAVPTPSAPEANQTAAKVASAKKSKPSKSPWKRRLEFGYTNQTGRKDRSDLSLRANFEWKDDDSEFRTTGRYLYGNTNSEKSTDNLSGSLRYRRNLAANSFANFETRYERDPIKRINHDLQQSVGAGHKLIQSEKIQLSLGAGGAAIYRSNVNEDAGWSYAIDAFQDFNYEINSWFSFNQDFSLLTKPLSDNELSINIKAALIGAITNSINMSMRYEYDYDNTLLPDARTSERWVTAVSYVF